MQEQRLTLRMKSYWDLIRKNNPIPDIRHFNPAAIEDMWPNCFEVRVHVTEHFHFMFNYMGALLIELYGKDLTGARLDERTPEFPGMVIHHKLDSVVQQASPLIDEGNFITRHNKLIKYRACLLPFGTASAGVTHIIVGMSYRVF